MKNLFLISLLLISTVIFAQFPAPTLVAPEQGAANVSVTPQFQWNAGGEWYQLQISTGSGFEAVLFDRTSDNVGVNQYTLPANILSTNSVYYWRMKTGVIQGGSPWSEVRTFTTGSVSGIGANGSEIIDYKLYNNYPNPFNPSTVIRYDLPGSDYVLLKIYDAIGNEVATLVNERQSGGSHSISFNASLLTNGIYFYKLVTENFSETKKMILVK